MIEKIIDNADCLFWSVDVKDNLQTGGSVNGLLKGIITFESNDNGYRIRLSKNLNGISDVYVGCIDINCNSDEFSILDGFILKIKKKLTDVDFVCCQEYYRDEFIHNVTQILDDYNS